MKTLRSFVRGEWHRAVTSFLPLHDPCSEEVIGQVSSAGIDFAAALAHARASGTALRALTLGQRGELLLALSRALQAGRDELIALSLENTGATRKDAKFDVDGGIFTLAYYGELGRERGSAPWLADADGFALSRSARHWGQHVLLPLAGAAVHVNAFNFPVWGLAEKAATALLAGMSVISKPATSSALVTERAFELLVGVPELPAGTLSLISGSTGNLIDLLGPQDVLAFTGSASTAMALRGKRNLLESSTRVNIEADSLNAAVLAPDVEAGSETWAVFLRDVVREMTQKSGQKCTAVRRILVPGQRIDEVQEALIERLAEVVVGNPHDPAVTMGPLATASQLDAALTGVALLRREADLAWGEPARIDSVGAAPGKGFFFSAVLLRAPHARRATAVHRHEVFGPVATLLPYDGSAAQAAEIVALAEGSLVTSLYGDDREFLFEFLRHGGSSTGRLYLGSEKVAAQLPGSGLAMPQLLHGGPGRAGGGAELGGWRGLELYTQRVALSGDRAIVERLAGSRADG